MFEFSDQRCKDLELEVIDTDLNATSSDLIATVNETVNGTRVFVTPKDPMDYRDYNFTVKATVEKKNFIIT